MGADQWARSVAGVAVGSVGEVFGCAFQGNSPNQAGWIAVPGQGNSNAAFPTAGGFGSQ